MMNHEAEDRLKGIERVSRDCEIFIQDFALKMDCRDLVTPACRYLSKLKPLRVQ